MSRSTARAGPIEVARYLDVEEGRWSLILRAGDIAPPSDPDPDGEAWPGREPWRARRV